MKKLSIIIFAAILLVSCKNNKVSTPEYNNNAVIASEEQEYRAMEDADKELKDSIDASKYNPDEYGICEGMPEMYETKNKEEESLIASLEDYYNSAMKNDAQKAKSYICPKVFSLAKEKFPQYSDDEIDKIVTSSIADFSKVNDFAKEHFEDFKKTFPLVTKLYKLPSKNGCFLYTVHFSILILSTPDDKTYYGWHLPLFVYAASPDNGKKWYFIELVEDTNEILKEFR
jgi:hypothetical protein